MKSDIPAIASIIGATLMAMALMLQLLGADFKFAGTCLLLGLATFGFNIGWLIHEKLEGEK